MMKNIILCATLLGVVSFYGNSYADTPLNAIEDASCKKKAKKKKATEFINVKATKKKSKSKLSLIKQDPSKPSGNGKGKPRGKQYC